MSGFRLTYPSIGQALSAELTDAGQCAALLSIRTPHTAAPQATGLFPKITFWQDTCSRLVFN